MRWSALFIVAVVVSVAACEFDDAGYLRPGPATGDRNPVAGDAPGFADTPAGGLSVIEREAVLLLVNTASVDELDREAGLDVRAARNIVAHRDGPDAIPGTADDDPFDDLAEIDDVSYVGPTAMAQLLAWAYDGGYVDRVLGVAPDCLIISEYVESAGSNNKALELYNCGSRAIELTAAGPYTACLVRNDDTECTIYAPIDGGSLAPGEVRTLCRTHDGTVEDPMDAIRDHCEVALPSLISFNGDDRLLVFRDDDGDGVFDASRDTVLDGFGRMATRPVDTPWSDVVLRRCDFAPLDPLAVEPFDDRAAFTVHSPTDLTDYGVPPVPGC